MNSHAIILVFFAGLIAIHTGQDCKGRGLRQFDDNLAKLFTIANSGRKFPTSTGQPLTEWCDQSENYLGEMDRFKSNCMEGLSKQFSGILLYSLKTITLRNYCRKNKQKQAEFVAAGPCLNRNNQIITKCYTNMINSIMGAKSAPNKLKIPHLCCAYTEIFDCLNEKLTKAPGCNEKHVDTLIVLVKGFAGNAMDLMCGDYGEDSDKCETLGPPPRNKKNANRWKSIAPPILDLISSFPAV